MNPIKETLKTYKDLIDRGKVAPDFYAKDTAELKRILALIRSGNMTPAEFDKLSDRHKWDVSDIIEDDHIMWLCKSCKSEQGTLRPHREFMGESYCDNCDSMLTRRTGGGQSDPFNYTFKRI